jgi:hypothetical protein
VAYLYQVGGLMYSGHDAVSAGLCSAGSRLVGKPVEVCYMQGDASMAPMVVDCDVQTAALAREYLIFYVVVFAYVVVLLVVVFVFMAWEAAHTEHAEADAGSRGVLFMHASHVSHASQVEEDVEEEQRQAAAAKAGSSIAMWSVDVDVDVDADADAGVYAGPVFLAVREPGDGTGSYVAVVVS